MSTPASPGPFLLTDQPGNTQRVEVVLQDGELRARFEGMDPGDELLPVADLAGTWERAPT